MKEFVAVDIIMLEKLNETSNNAGKRTSHHITRNQQNTSHSFTWKVISDAPKNNRERKNLEALFIARLKPKLNEQLDTQLLLLFCFGIT